MEMPEPVESAPQVRVLGAVAAFRDELEVSLGGRLQRSVLGVLVAGRGAALTPARVVDLVWSGAPPPTATATLQSYVSHLRRALDPGRSGRSRDGVLRSGPGGYSLHLPSAAVDAWEFEDLVVGALAEPDPMHKVAALSRALGLWRGEPFSEYGEEAWVTAEASRWQQLRVAAEVHLLAARLDVEPPTLVLPDLEVAVHDAPFDEERWRLLALGLYRANRQTDALDALRRARESLVDQWGLEPTRDLQELEVAILNQDGALRVEAQARAAARHARRMPDDLVDRDVELGSLHALVREASAGRGAAVLIDGPAGIGKTRLLAETSEHAGQSGFRVLRARCGQFEHEFSFGAVRQLFEAVVAEEPALLEASPVLLSVLDATEPPGTDSLFAILSHLHRLLLDLSTSRPVLVSVDDLQWCDTGSLRFLDFLVRRLEGTPVLVVATVRSGERGADAELVDELRRVTALSAITPTPLTFAGVERLVAARLGEETDRDFIEVCHRMTGGNPLLLGQLLRALEVQERHPTTVDASTVTDLGARAITGLILGRLTTVAPAATEVVRAIAVLGSRTSLAEVAALAEVTEGEARAAVEALVRAEILEDSAPLGFAHPLVREAVRDAVPAALRDHLHSRAARMLFEANGASEQVAAQLLQVVARGDRWVVETLMTTARRATEVGTPESAVVYLRRALAEPPPAEVRPFLLVELGAVEALVDGAAAAVHLREAYDLLSPGPEKSAVARILVQVLTFSDDGTAAPRFAVEAAAAAAPGSDDQHSLIGLGQICSFMSGLEPAQWPRPASDADERPTEPRLAIGRAGQLAMFGGNRDEVIELCDFITQPESVTEVESLVWTSGAILLELAEVDLTQVWEWVRRHELAHGSVFGIFSVHVWSGFSALRRGELARAAELLTTARTQLRAWGSEVALLYCDAFLVETLVGSGDLEGARRVLPDVPEGLAGDGARLVGQAETELLIAEGRFDDALAVSDRLAEVMDSVVNPVHRRWHQQRAHVLEGLGRSAEARSLATHALELAEAWGAPRQVQAARATLRGIPG